MESLKDPQHYMPGEATLGHIRESIDGYNAERPAIFNKAQVQVIVSMSCFALVSVGLLYLTFGVDKKNTVFSFVAVGLIFAGFKLWEWAWKPVTDHQLALRYRLFPKIFGFIGDVRYSNGREPAFLRDIDKLKLVQYTSSENDDVVAGNHDGLRFELIEAKLIQGSGKHKTTVFKGMILHFQLETPFPGMLLAAKGSNWFQKWVREWWGKQLHDLTSGDEVIDQTHEFRTDNYRAAAPIVRGQMVSALKYLQREWSSGEVRMALHQQNCYLLLPSDRDYFELPHISENVDYDRDIKPMIRDMVVLLAVAHLVRKLGAPEVEIPAEPEASPAADDGADSVAAS